MYSIAFESFELSTDPAFQNLMFHDKFDFESLGRENFEF